MLISAVRVKGERDTWWNNIIRLLSGRGIRRDSPEELAMAEAIKALQTILATTSKDASHTAIHIAISHDGEGADRAATVVAFANPDEKVV